MRFFTILMMWAELATLGLLKIKVFWNKGYDVIISSVHDVTKNFYHVTYFILNFVLNYTVDVVMWPKFGN